MLRPKALFLKTFFLLFRLSRVSQAFPPLSVRWFCGKDKKDNLESASTLIWSIWKEWAKGFLKGWIVNIRAKSSLSQDIVSRVQGFYGEQKFGFLDFLGLGLA